MGTGTPAESLEGLEIRNHWKIIEHVKKGPHSTGGHFSNGYIVEDHSGTRAYLKALDFSAALHDSDPARALEQMTKAFNFERDLLYKCKTIKMSKVVLPIEDGTIDVPGFPAIGKVQFIIFELSQGDIRDEMERLRSIDLAFSLRSLHHTAVGLWQLHRKNIAHQDLKPSNVLFFQDRISKVGDLGRASDSEVEYFVDRCPIPGDRGYAPFEQYYGFHVYNDFRDRQASDMWLLGSLFFFHFQNVSARTAIISKLKDNVGTSLVGGTFDTDLPLLQQAFGETIQDLKKETDSICPNLSNDILPIVKHLCDPDPRRRGQLNIGGPENNRYSLEKYVSKINVLARKAELGVYEY